MAVQAGAICLLKPIWKIWELVDWVKHNQRRAFALLLAGALCGCGHYAPAPLHPAVVALAPADMAALNADAEKIDRPFLSPQSIDISRPLTPNALAVIAVIENPDLKALRAAAGVSDAQAFAARLLPDPTVALSADKVISGPDDALGLGAQFGFDLTQLRTARVRRESAAAGKRKVRLDLAWAEWQTSGAARLQGVRILALASQLGLAQESAASAEREYFISHRAALRGDLAAAEVDARRQAMLDASARLRTVEKDLDTARGELNRLLGLTPGTKLLLAAPEPPAKPPAASVLVDQALVRRLDLQALRAGYAAAEADVHKAVLEQFPNLSLTIAAARDTASNYTIGPGIGFSLPLWNRNRGAILAAQATRTNLQAEYDARLFMTRAEINAAISGLATVDRQRAELIAQMPASEAFAVKSERAAQRGDLSRVVAATARQAVRDRQLALLQLDQQAAEQTIALELLSGGPSEAWGEGWTK